MNNVPVGSYTLTAKAVDTTGHSVTSNPITVTAISVTPIAPVVTANPVSQTVTAPATATFTVAASGTPAPTYQWMQSVNGGAYTAISGAASASYTTSATTVSESGTQFKCVASNAAGSVTSSAASLTVNPAPVAPNITAQPVNQTVTAPAAATFTVAASGTPAPAYQWMQSVNGGAYTAISGATSASYTTPATAASESGTQYKCVATNASGSVTSSAASLTVNTAPSLPVVAITSPVNGSNVTPGSNVTITVNASEANGTIAQVQIFNGATLLYTTNSSSFNYIWAVNLLPGSYVLTARATDSNGVVVTSAPVTITISLPGIGSRF